MNDPQSLAAPDTRFDRLHRTAGALAATLALARELVGSGRTVDLAGLNDRIGALCAQALDLPPEQGRRLRPALRSLDDRAAEIEAALAAARPDAAPGGGAAAGP